jgi:hypothetical protein
MEARDSSFTRVHPLFENSRSSMPMPTALDIYAFAHEFNRHRKDGEGTSYELHRLHQHDELVL